VGAKTRPYGHGLYSISSGMLLQDVTVYLQYLTSNGFRNYVASTNRYFGFVINYSYSDVWELLMNCCNKCCVMLNHYDLGCSRFGLKSLLISWTTGVIWAQVWEFDCFGDCFFLDLCSYNLDGSVTQRSPGIRATRLAVKVHNLCRVKTVIIVMLTVTSGPKNSENK
jgi:hypothetical protein